MCKDAEGHYIACIWRWFGEGHWDTEEQRRLYIASMWPPFYMSFSFIWTRRTILTLWGKNRTACLTVGWLVALLLAPLELLMIVLHLMRMIIMFVVYIAACCWCSLPTPENFILMMLFTVGSYFHDPGGNNGLLAVPCGPGYCLCCCCKDEAFMEIQADIEAQNLGNPKSLQMKD